MRNFSAPSIATAPATTVSAVVNSSANPPESIHPPEAMAPSTYSLVAMSVLADGFTPLTVSTSVRAPATISCSEKLPTSAAEVTVVARQEKRPYSTLAAGGPASSWPYIDHVETVSPLTAAVLRLKYVANWPPASSWPKSDHVATASESTAPVPRLKYVDMVQPTWAPAPPLIDSRASTSSTLMRTRSRSFPSTAGPPKAVSSCTVF